MLTKVQKQKLTHFFNVLDYDGSHTVEKSDFESLGQSICTLLACKEGTREYDQYMNRCIDQWEDLRGISLVNNESHSISLEQWLDYSNKAIINDDQNTYVKRLTDQIFKVFDTNNDGYISLDEFVDLLLAYRIDVRYSARSFTSIDQNGDDRISYDELFEALLEYFKSSNKDAQGNWLFGRWED